MSGKRNKRSLTREEELLWAHVTRNDARLASAAALTSDPPPSATSEKSGQDDQAKTLAATVATAKPKSTPANARPAKSAAKAMTSLAHFDHRLNRRLSRGQTDIDARLDLHGLRQDEAFSALRVFLHRCQFEGHRHVLIITGKGARSSDEDNGGDVWRTSPRGILRRLVPQWLSDPILRHLVVSFTSSAPRHGDSGALYVTLRKAKA